jgi:hypothetical protein
VQVKALARDLSAELSNEALESLGAMSRTFAGLRRQLRTKSRATRASRGFKALWSDSVVIAEVESIKVVYSTVLRLAEALNESQLKVPVAIGTANAKCMGFKLEVLGADGEAEGQPFSRGSIAGVE